MILSTGDFAREIGSQGLLDSFFTTVGCRLEPDGRATRFPAVMGDLYDGVLLPDRAAEALAELAQIERELRLLAAEKVPGVSGRVSGDAYRLLASPDGRPLVEHLRAAFEES